MFNKRVHLLVKRILTHSNIYNRLHAATNTHTDCTRQCNVEWVLVYFIVHIVHFNNINFTKLNSCSLRTCVT